MSGVNSIGDKFDRTLIILCPVCASDYGETLGVTGPMDGALAATIVMRCGDCATVYLSPPPTRSKNGADNDETVVQVFADSVRRLQQRIPPNTRFLSADASAESLLAHDTADGRFDLILLPLLLESTPDPHGLLGHASALLDDQGAIEIVVGNAESSCFSRFGARHWCGYRFPRVQRQFSASGIRVLARNAGLEVNATRTEPAPCSWLLSMRNWLNDWGAGKVWIVLLTGPWFVPWLVAALLEMAAGLRGRGAVLVARLEKGVDRG